MIDGAALRADRWFMELVHALVRVKDMVPLAAAKAAATGLFHRTRYVSLFHVFSECLPRAARPPLETHRRADASLPTLLCHSARRRQSGLVGIGSPSFSGGAFSIGGGDCLAGVTGVGPSGAGGPPAGLEGPRRLSR
jgi:hypothetical protein